MKSARYVLRAKKENCFFFFKKNPGRNCVRNNRREEEVEMVAGRI